jgi:acyl-CoA synthetase (AMP-forming)/AMP-acid ligase II
VTAWAAAARIGAIVIPVNTFYSAAELERFMRHADVQYVIGVRSFAGHDYFSQLSEIADDLPHLRRLLLDDPCVEELSDEQPSSRSTAMQADVHPGDPLFITYTSGSTGEPKGVVHSHGGAIRHARNLAALSGIDSTSRIWTPMPLCWVGGFQFGMLRAMSVGGCFVTQEQFDPGTALKLVGAERVTNMAAWPAVSKAMLEHPDFRDTDFSALRGPASFYEALPPDRRPPDPGLASTSLGMSETCGPHTFWCGDEEVTGVPPEYRGAFGHQVPGMEHRIVDPDTGADLAPGTEGEVLVRGYSLMLGLYKHERAEVFDADGWYHTGDMGYFRDGYFFFTGRRGDMIKTAGANVAPAEVERVLLTMPEVKLAFVVGIPDPVRGQQVVAAVVPWEPESFDERALTSTLREQLATYKVPSRVVSFPEEDLPWLVSQKVDRRALARLLEQASTTSEGER